MTVASANTPLHGAWLLGLTKPPGSQQATSKTTPAVPAATPQSRLNDFYAKMQAPSWYTAPEAPQASPNVTPHMPGPSPFLSSMSVPVRNPMAPTPLPVAPRAPAAAPPVAPFMASNSSQGS